MIIIRLPVQVCENIAAIVLASDYFVCISLQISELRIVEK